MQVDLENKRGNTSSPDAGFSLGTPVRHTAGEIWALLIHARLLHTPCVCLNGREHLVALSWSREVHPVVVCAQHGASAQLEWEGSQNRFSSRPGLGSTY